MNRCRCKNCGYPRLEFTKSGWKCPACFAEYFEESLPSEAAIQLSSAFSQLSIQEFSTAEELFAGIIEKYPRSSDAYWGLVCSRYGIKYEEDFNGKKIPTCCFPTIESFKDDPYYKKALKYADSETAAWYIEQADYIDRVRETWVNHVKDEPDYDVFICYKDSDEQNGIERTEDSKEAAELYWHLKEKGYSVFYSRESLRNKLGLKYEPYIFGALQSAKIMIVFCSKIEYIESTWVKNEWRRYYKKIANGEKRRDSLIVAFSGFSPSSLPGILSSCQHIYSNSKNFFYDIDEKISTVLGDDKAEKEHADRRTRQPVSPLHRHKYKDIIIKPTCVSKGCTEHRCACGEAYRDSWTQLGDHDFALTDHIDPTCTQEGRDCYTCSICGEKNSKIIPALGHKYGEWIESRHPSCERTGVKVRQCSVCGATEESSISMLEHKWLPPTVRTERDGQKHYIAICELCGGEKEVNEAAFAEYNERIRREREEAEREEKYVSAIKLFNEGKYEDAIKAFEKCKGYKESKKQIEKCQASLLELKYANAQKLMSQGQYGKASVIFASLNGYKDSDRKIQECASQRKEQTYNLAIKQFNDGQFGRALATFKSLKGFKDSAEQIRKCESEIKKKEAEEKARREWERIKAAQVGGIIKLGRYAQQSGGAQTPIEWQVLYKTPDNRLLLLSKHILIARPFDCFPNDRRKSRDFQTEWVGSNIRKALKQFFCVAFNSEEQLAIIPVWVDNLIDSGEGVRNSELDKVFILSSREVGEYLPTIDSRRCLKTPRCYGESAPFACGTASWWLRTPGSENGCVQYVDADGFIIEKGCPSEDNLGVRPALWIDLESLLLGSVDNPEPIGAVSKEDNKTALGNDSSNVSPYCDMPAEEDDECVIHKKRSSGKKSQYAIAIEKFNNGDYLEAFNIFLALKGYKDSDVLMMECELALNEKKRKASNERKTNFYAVCSACGRLAKLKFRPVENKPVYCSSCFKERKKKRKISKSNKAK